MANEKEIPLYENRPLPVDEEAERFLLGGILRDEHVLGMVKEVIASDDFFYYERHRLIWNAMAETFSESKPIDVLTLSETLEKAGKLEKAGGREFLFDLIDAVGSSANVEWNLNHLKEKFVLRQLIQTSNEIIKKSLDASNSPDEILQKAQDDVFKIAKQQIRNSLRPIESFIKPLIENLTKKTDGITGIKTGFVELDELTNGLQKSDLIILAARPGVGKTSFALNLAANAAIDNGHKVAFFSLEMDGMQLAQRLLSSRIGIDQSKLRSRKLSQDDIKLIIAQAGTISEAPLHVDDNADLGIMELMSKAKELARENSLDLLIIDYLQLMKTGKEENRAVAIGAISRGLKILAKDLQIPVIALAQLSRKVEEKGRDRPQLSDLRESGSIEQDADMVWFIERQYVRTHKEEDLHDADLIVAKHRNGSVKDIKLYFEPSTTTFKNATAEEEEEYSPEPPWGGDDFE